MIERRVKKTIQGQTALILILLAAAALIFLSITLNWGRIAQTKTMLSIAADQGASMLASDAASYGEMEKQTNLKDKNEVSGLSGIILDLIMVVVAIIVLIITIVSWGSASSLWVLVFAIAAVAFSVVNLALQIAVIQPGMAALWNKLQKDQPIQQQFFEGGIGAGLQGAITDQVNVSDYLDENVNGIFGTIANTPKDVISRFGFFYTERLKMLNKTDIPQVKFFYNQLGEFMNSETCYQNFTENNSNPSIPINPSCIDPDTGLNYCGTDPSTPSSDPACQMQVPILVTCAQNVYEYNNLPASCKTDPTDAGCIQLNAACNACNSNPLDPSCQLQVSNEFSFQLNDSCIDSDPASAAYNPYCDPCCQPQYVPGSSPPKALRPSSCSSDAQCATNNPYGPSYPDIYDQSYQEYANGISFLDQFGRDEQMVPAASVLPLTSMSPLGNFPNGVYPFFWLMANYSPEVDNIDTSTITHPYPPVANSQDIHWCSAATAAANGIDIPAFTNPTGFTDLAQLSLPYTCQGEDCCVNYLPESLTTGIPTPPSATAPNWVIDTVGATIVPLIATTAWLPADNQMCSTSGWPYNGKSTYFPDGSCEWTGTVVTGGSAPTIDPTKSTLDSLDDTMHTLSDFSNFSQSMIGKDFGTINSTFDTWYPQAATWIAPKCTCSENDFDNQNCTDATCNPGTDGRLLSIYNPGTGVDVLKDWNTSIVNWLKNTYANPTAWCLPPVTTGSASEDNYINVNSGEGTSPANWGDLPHVIACLNYNAGPNPSVNIPNAANYQSCLNDLTSGVCPTTIPDTCASSLVGNIPATVIPWDSTDVHRCQTYYIDPTNGNQSVANWVSSNINFGSVYNYQNCLNLLTNACPTKLQGTVCDPSVVGRTLLNATTEPEPAFNGASSCALAPGSYAQWVKDNITLATDEAPKFALRVAFLADVYSRAQTMQNITIQGDTALHNFFKTCTGCAGDTTSNTCSAGGTCADGSACGSPLGKCEDGGPAAQLIYARTQGNPARSLPNSVIYGWVDKTLANGKTLPGSLLGAGGYAHVVKVTAYSPGRDGNGEANLRGLQPSLPNIHSWSTFFEQKYALQNRDGNVYVSVKRWDQDHTNCDDGSACIAGVCQGDKTSCGILFPNGHLLWQIMSHNPTSPLVFTGNNPLSVCTSLYPGTPGVTLSPPGLGFGIQDTMVQGISFNNQLSTQDRIYLANAFMLNDNGNGQVDSNAANNGNVCTAGSSPYCQCVTVVNALLASGTESHACARYVASLGNNDPSGDGDGDYSLKFIDCNSIDNGSPPQTSP